MHSNIVIRRHKNFLEIAVSGPLSQVTRKKVLSIIRSHGSENRCFLINLLKTDFAKNEPIVGAFDLVEYMISIGIDHSYFLSFAAKGEIAKRKFFEEAAFLKGLNITYSSSTDEAIAKIVER